jgi:hypothetical protein
MPSGYYWTGITCDEEGPRIRVISL